MKELADDSFDSIVTDPPYGINFMGKEWDGPQGMVGQMATGDEQRGAYAYGGSHSRGYADNDNVLFQQWCETWLTESLRVLKPGGHLLAFGATRTFHRLTCAAEDAGFEIRDAIFWCYGSGFPKSMNVGKAIDKAAGATREVVETIPDRWAGKGSVLARSNQEPAGTVDITTPATPEAHQWQGWGTALKPAVEPIVVARKSLSEKTVAKNVLKHGTGGINIDGTRVGEADGFGGGAKGTSGFAAGYASEGFAVTGKGRWPANLILSDDDPAEWAKFFHNFPLVYQPKANKKERPVVDGQRHPTVKPLALMRNLVRLVTPPGGVVLDPFAGSGTTVEACVLEGFQCHAIEREPGYLPFIHHRVDRVQSTVGSK